MSDHLPKPYVYRASPLAGDHDETLYTVGFYGPNGWEPVEDFTDEGSAQQAVHYLNGEPEVHVHCEAKQQSLLSLIQALQSQLRVVREERDDLMGQRHSARQLAYSLSEYVKGVNEGKSVEYPAHLMAEVELARGISSYQFPSGGHTLE